MIKIKMLKSLMGTPSYRKGAIHEVDSETANKWEAAGLCEIIKVPKVSRKKKTIRK